MKLTLKDDYYEWFCDWCDSINVTLIHRVADGTFSCSACHRLTGKSALNLPDVSDASRLNKVYQHQAR